MRRITAIVAVLALVAFAVVAGAADSFTVTAVANTEADFGSGWPSSFKVVKAAWKAAADGVKANENIPALMGKVVMVVTDPGATAPADNYSLQLKDSAGVDILGGAGASRDTANSEQIMPKWGTDYFHARPVYGPITFSVSATANADCNGEVFIYYEE
jgi:hypothetical protein